MVADVDDAGTYRLDVAADGDWAIHVAQPEYSSGTALPAAYSGDRDTVTEPFQTHGREVEVTYAHGGDGNFIVWVWTAGGERETLIANEIGQTSGTRGPVLDTGVYLLEVTADGDWEIAVD